MQFNISHKRLYRSLLNMIEWTKQQQNRAKDARVYLSPKAWAKEMATVKFCLPRQSGHTTFALKLLTEYFENAIIVVPLYTMIFDKFSDLDFSYKRRIVSIDRIINVQGLEIDAIIVDCASLISQTKIDKIYEVFPHVKCFLFLE